MSNEILTVSEWFDLVRDAFPGAAYLTADVLMRSAEHLPRVSYSASVWPVVGPGVGRRGDGSDPCAVHVAETPDACLDGLRPMVERVRRIWTAPSPEAIEAGRLGVA